MLKTLSRAVLVVAALTATAVFPVAVDAQLVATGVDCMYVSGYPGFSPTPLACSGAWAGNNLNQASLVSAKIQELWGTGWTQVGTTNTNDSGGPFKAYGDDINDGVLKFKTPFTGMFILILKTANAFSMYQFGAVTALEEVEFVTDGVALNAQGRPQGLSHATLWEKGGTTVPEPSTVVLLGTGLLALGLVGYRRREND